MSKTDYNFLETLRQTKEIIEPILVEKVVTSTTHPRLRQAMIHAISGSGKYIRPHLVRLFAKNMDQNTLDLACAIEILHTYSLIHDDLPCMDNADLRRGQPSVWKAFDQATAVLAGDALIPLSYHLILTLDLDSVIKVELLKKFCDSIGGRGLVAGQMMDLFPSTNLTDIEQMQLLKTGELLSFCCVAGTILSQGLNSSHEILAREFGLKLGLIYQITDDLLSVQGTPDLIGKPVQNDDDKVTFVSVYGVDQSQKMIQDLSQNLDDLSKKLNLEKDLTPLISFIVNRNH